MRNLMNMVLDHVGLLRLFFIASAASLLHYWAFVARLPGLGAALVDATFFAQFQAILIYSFAISSAVFGYALGALTVAARYTEDHFGENAFTRTIRYVSRPIISVSLWVLTFVATYTLDSVLRVLFPFLYDFWNHKALAFGAIPIAIGALVVVGSASRRRAAGLAPRPWRTRTEYFTPWLVFMGPSIVLISAIILGAARADLLERRPTGTLTVGAHVYEVVHVGVTSYGIVVINQDCECLEFYPFDAIQSIRAPKRPD